MRIACLATLVIALAACNEAPQDVVPDNAADSLPPVDAAAANAPAAAVTMAPPAPANVDGVTMTLTPIKTDNCQPNKYTTEVSWSIPASVPFSGVEVRVEKPDGGLLAFKKARVYTQKSGAWVREGTQFFLVDKDSRTILARAKAGPYDCQ